MFCSLNSLFFSTQTDCKYMNLIAIIEMISFFFYNMLMENAFICFMISVTDGCCFDKYRADKYMVINAKVVVRET